MFLLYRDGKSWEGAFNAQRVVVRRYVKDPRPGTETTTNKAEAFTLLSEDDAHLLADKWYEEYQIRFNVGVA